jgi:hypothetical protein
MDTPESMKSELAAWNDGSGIDLESWIGCEGRFSLAVGYTTLFWPEFVLFEGYILRKGFAESSLRGFEGSKSQSKINRRSVEWTLNHLHLVDTQYQGCEDASKDKFLLLGNILKEIYQAKLLWQFPDNPCTVQFHIPADEEDLVQYQVSFWQKCHE